MGSFVGGALESHPDVSDFCSRLRLQHGIPNFFGKLGVMTRDCKYEDANSRFAIFMHKVKYTTPDGIEHKQMNYFYIILAQIRNICRLNHLIL